MKHVKGTAKKTLTTAGLAAIAMTGLLSLPNQFKAATSASSTPTAADVVHFGTTEQQIVGFGASGAFGAAQQLESMPSSQKLLSLLFSPTKGIGLTIVRSLVNDGVDGQTIEPSQGMWNWDLSTDDQIWLMKQAQKFGPMTLMSTPWSPPAWMKKNNNVVGDKNDVNNVLLPKYYHAYAVYLAKYVTGYWHHFHIKVNVISLQNEPNWNVNYASCVWTPEQFDTFIRNDLIPVFKHYHVTAKVMMPEELDWSEQYAVPTLEDPVASKAVSIVAAHGYGGTIAPFPMSESAHKQVWETEYSTFGKDDASITDGLHWAEVVNEYLTVANVNAWNYWWLDYDNTDNESLINVHPGTGKYTVNKRLYTIGNYSKFVRPGYVRLDAERNPAPGVFLSAFKDPKTGHFAVVVVNENTESAPLKVNIRGLRQGPASVIPYVTSAKQNLQQGQAVPLSNGGFTATLPAESVTTFVGN